MYHAEEGETVLAYNARFACNRWETEVGTSSFENEESCSNLGFFTLEKHEIILYSWTMLSVPKSSVSSSLRCIVFSDPFSDREKLFNDTWLRRLLVYKYSKPKGWHHGANQEIQKEVGKTLNPFFQNGNTSSDFTLLITRHLETYFRLYSIIYIF